MSEAGPVNAELQRALRIELSKWTEPHQVTQYDDAVSETEQREDLEVPDVVNSAAAINNGWCRVFAERVYDRLGEPADVSVESDGVTHTWLESRGLCYNAACHDGVAHPADLPAYTER